jgi:lipid II:glycine glycyltransferase (peptidoglycan interpeptide bridge formation enzyme)
MLWSVFTQNWRLIGLESNAFFASFEPGYRIAANDDVHRNGVRKFIKSKGWKKTKQIQPEFEGVIDIAQSKEKLLEHMHQKTRYNIRLSEKKNLTIEQKNNKEGLQIFWDMLQETASRDKISMYPYSYYRKIHTILYESSKRGSNKIPVARIWIVKSEKGEPLSSALMVTFGKTAYYLYGASSNKKRNQMSNYFMQWKMMMWCKEKGFENYDMGGIAPPNITKKHPWESITRFKKGFGAETMQYPGTFTYPYHTFWYNLYTTVKWIKRYIR